MILGLTGGSGCGTSLAGMILKEEGWYFIDCDKVYHELLLSDRDLAKKLAEEFGPSVINSEGIVDRRALGKIVFSDASALERLNAVTHPIIYEKVLSLISKSEKSNVCIEAVELIESNINSLCTAVVAVLADRETRVYRIMIRDALLKTEAEKRIDAQHEDSYYLSACDKCIYNNGTISEFKEQLLSFIESIYKSN